MKKIALLLSIILLFSCGTDKKDSNTNSKKDLKKELMSVVKEQMKNKEWEKAEKKLNELIDLEPNSAYLYFQRGLVKEMNLKYKECIPDFTKVIELDPKMKFSRTNRGYAYRHIGESEKAIEDFKAEMSINPEAVYSYEHISMVYYLDKDYKNALENVNIAIEKDSTNSICFKTRALIFKATENKEKACTDKEKAVEMGILKDYPDFKTDITELNNYCSK